MAPVPPLIFSEKRLPSPSPSRLHRRLPSKRLVRFVAALLVVGCLVAFGWRHPQSFDKVLAYTHHPGGRVLDPPVSCFGARGKLLNESADDDLHKIQGLGKPTTID